MAWPKASAAQVEKLDANMGGKAERRKMFGHPCYFLRGYMIAGVFGDTIFLRLPEGRMNALIAAGQGSPFEPVSGRPMAAYIQIADPPPGLFEEALEFADSLPEKTSRKKGR